LTRAHFRANLMAASLASVPELEKNTLSPNERSTSLLASFTFSRQGTTWTAAMIRRELQHAHLQRHAPAGEPATSGVGNGVRSHAGVRSTVTVRQADGQRTILSSPQEPCETGCWCA
jgi:hypothetical protein